MKTIIGGRQSGKTTKLIEMAAETGATIVTANSHMADYIKVLTHKMGKDIKDPICITKIINTKGSDLNSVFNRSLVAEHLLIDEAQIVLEQILKYYCIDAITVNIEENK